jgi:hypothetical protein
MEGFQVVADRQAEREQGRSGCVEVQLLPTVGVSDTEDRAGIGTQH